MNAHTSITSRLKAINQPLAIMAPKTAKKTVKKATKAKKVAKKTTAKKAPKKK